MLSLSIPSNETFTHLYNYSQDCLKNIAISIFKKGRTPKHIGFILDGNRRFARKMGASSTQFGHYEGLKSLENILEVCLQLGVLEITVFAFSIENFKRSPEEVEYLMELFKKTFMDFCDNNNFIQTNGIRVNFLGDLSYLPSDIAEIAKKVMEKTKDHNKHIFNICCPYTSRNEMTTSIKKNIELIQEGKMDKDDLNQSAFEQQLSTTLPLDILVRTSGEIRLSDFLLYQAADNGCQIHFIDCYWPEFTVWKLLPILLEYQIYYDHTKKRNQGQYLEFE
ncbi:unnamed protein product [Cunninghamella blakesleeana]